jgi:hypothetical protein
VANVAVGIMSNKWINIVFTLSYKNRYLK